MFRLDILLERWAELYRPLSHNGAATTPAGSATTPAGSATTPDGFPSGSPSVPPFPEGEILLDAAIFIQGEKGDKGDKGDPGSDADVTAENIERALDGTPLLSITTEQLNAIFD